MEEEGVFAYVEGDSVFEGEDGFGEHEEDSGPVGGVGGIEEVEGEG